MGVLGLIIERDSPQPVPRGVVEAILALTAPDETVDWDQYLTAGGKVRILTGPFVDQLGILRHLNDPGRARAQLENMDASRKLTLERRGLFAAQRPCRMATAAVSFYAAALVRRPALGSELN